MEGETMIIQVLGPGCQHCKALFSNVQIALDRLHMRASVEYITNLETISQYNVLRTPGLVINGKLSHQGKVLAPIELEGIIKANA